MPSGNASNASINVLKLLVLMRNQYKSFSASWFVNYVVEENEAMKAKSEFDEGKPNESLQLFLSNVEDLHDSKEPLAFGTKTPVLATTKSSLAPSKVLINSSQVPAT
jgi:hypothetical protein